jgi:outer membrane protein TolC
VELRDTLGRRGARAGVLAAELQRERLLARRHQLAEQLRDELSMLQVTLHSGAGILRLSAQREEAERRKYEAELERYRDGRSDSATLIQFEGELAAAERDARLQRLALLLAGYQHAWARGALLPALGIDDDTGGAMP